MFHKIWELLVIGKTFQTAKVTFKVIQGHWQWCHLTGHIRFTISLSLQLCLLCRTINEIVLVITQNADIIELSVAVLLLAGTWSNKQ